MRHLRSDNLIWPGGWDGIFQILYHDGIEFYNISVMGGAVRVVSELPRSRRDSGCLYELHDC